MKSKPLSMKKLYELTYKHLVSLRAKGVSNEEIKKRKDIFKEFLDDVWELRKMP